MARSAASRSRAVRIATKQPAIQVSRSTREKSLFIMVRVSRTGRTCGGINRSGIGVGFRQFVGFPEQALRLHPKTGGRWDTFCDKVCHDYRCFLFRLRGPVGLLNPLPALREDFVDALFADAELVGQVRD